MREWAKNLKRQTLALYLAARDPRTPTLAKILATVVVAYALSPIDLIPDFVPVLGYLDDVILLPIGIWLVLKLIPEEVMAESRAQAETISKLPHSRAAAVVIVLLWLAGISFCGLWFYLQFIR